MESQNGAASHKIKILLVDDEEDFRAIVNEKLSGYGYDVVEAYDGISGLDGAKIENPDLILLDTMLPNLTGAEVYRQLKDDPTTRSIPVIVLSALNEVSIEIVKDTADTFISKYDFDAQELHERIQQILSA